MFLDEINGKNICLKQEIVVDETARSGKLLVTQARILKKLLDKNIERLRVFKELTHKMSVDEIKTFLLNNKKKSFLNQSAFYYIYDKKENQLVGCVQLRIDNKKATRSLFIDKDFSGLGYAQEALQLSEDYLFNEKNIDNLVEFCYRLNPSFERAKHQVEQVGFKPLNGISVHTRGNI